MYACDYVYACVFAMNLFDCEINRTHDLTNGLPPLQGGDGIAANLLRVDRGRGGTQHAVDDIQTGWVDVEGVEEGCECLVMEGRAVEFECRC